ncbi:ankyrin repeat-containing domain protein [Pseudomassariella vexata]|uniref:Ankyrin repeat-containing domain protein n=1 Tax=Pseudomassariella vexata TaxID=1141098 RepID=A0A1Y2DI89_9PEZI|nr:ankyrin repeat-containing domain protein [Pseudomassariella vexata]ORY58856.1 ankyrin repeat-containing domain protein [Pseudomassariella vexata]
MNAEERKAELGEDLVEACHQNQRQTVEILVDQRLGSASDPQKFLSYLLTEAVGCNALDVVAFCLERGTTVTIPVMAQIAGGSSAGYSFPSHRALVEAKAVDINHYIPWFGDVLGLAAQDNNLEWARFCLEHGADPNMNKIDEYKHVLAAVAEEGHVQMAELLLQYGAKLEGSGAIAAAGETGRKEMVRFLLEKGASVNELSVEFEQEEGHEEEVGSALHKAIRNGHVETALFLVCEGGSDLELKDGHGMTAKALAEKGRYTELLERMRRREVRG